ncbi:MAG: hypothetical protein GVY36_03085 [Verrucomicrobia bacterium]|nr:hypothetical protein [Verrucomicrobiota bacterium]
MDPLDVDLPEMEDSFTVNAGTDGIGAGSLLGNTRGSIGIGMSDVSVFGLKTRAERILFVIDADREMVTDKKGGLNSYKVIKDEITDMVANLSTGTLFNVILHDGKKTLGFKNQLVSAGQEIHRELVEWIAPINSNASSPGLEGVAQAGRPSLTTFRDHEVNKALRLSGGRANETAFIAQHALEQNLDAVFFITGYHRGFERIRRRPTERENKDWERTTSSNRYQKQLEAHRAEIPLMKKRIEEELKRQNKVRKSKGLPPRVLGQRHGFYSNANELGLEWENPHPGFQPLYWINERDVRKYFRDLVKEIYTDKGGEEPSLNVILFLAGDETFRDEWAKSLDRYVRANSGKNRVIRGEDEIKSARSAQDTKN